jgi:hypothetical protein
MTASASSRVAQPTASWGKDVKEPRERQAESWAQPCVIGPRAQEPVPRGPCQMIQSSGPFATDQEGREGVEDSGAGEVFFMS